METVRHEKQKSFVRRFTQSFTKSISKHLSKASNRRPTEVQLKTWVNEGGQNFGDIKKVSLVNGVLCQTWSEKFRATLHPYINSFKKIFDGNN